MKMLVSVDAKELQASLKGFPERLVKNIITVTTRFSIAIQRAVKEMKLTGQVLHNRTGTLRRSINREMVFKPGEIGAIVGTNVNYAGIHEYGGIVPAHLVTAKRAAALRFMGAGGKFVFRKSVMIPAVQMPERSFLRSTLQEFEGAYRDSIQIAALNAFKASK